jgi:hypothetical protein
VLPLELRCGGITTSRKEEKKQGNMVSKARNAGVDVKALGEKMAAEKSSSSKK